MKKVYISGRIKDYAEYMEHFDVGVEMMQGLGHIAVNPCTLGEADYTYEQFMRADIRALIDCDAIFMLTGWEKSSGARCEHLVATMCGLELWYQ